MRYIYIAFAILSTGVACGNVIIALLSSDFPLVSQFSWFLLSIAGVFALLALADKP